MKLCRLGDYIELIEGRNKEGLFDVHDVRGISTKKVFIDTKADMEGVSIFSYKTVAPTQFAYVADTSRRGDKISLAYNDSNQTYLVSSITTVFQIRQENIAFLSPTYLYMYLIRPEFDRYSRFNSWGSAREAFTWESMCEIELPIPSIEIQQKYVDVYKALVANQKAYEFGLDDMKVVCDAYIEDLRKKNPLLRIGGYIEQRDEKNIDYQVKFAQGISVDNVFIPAKRVADDTDSGRIVRTGQFAYNKVMKANGTKLPIAYRTGEDCFVSGSYQVFEVTKKDQLLSEYLLLWLKRSETQRYAGFISWGSTRDILLFETLCELQIPIPDLRTQKLIVDIYNASEKRRSINERLKQQISDICPILIKGSIEEAQRG